MPFDAAVEPLRAEVLDAIRYLEAGIEFLETREWVQRAFFNTSSFCNADHFSLVEGKVEVEDITAGCIAGAVFIGGWKSGRRHGWTEDRDDPLMVAWKAIASSLASNPVRWNPVRWNDAPGRTKEEVLAVMRDATDLLRSGRIIHAI